MKQRTVLQLSLVVMVVALVETGAALGAGEGNAKAPIGAQPASNKTFHLSGVVLDTKGKPLENVEVVLTQSGPQDFSRTEMGCIKTGADGRFRFDLDNPPLYKMLYCLTASKPGYAWGGCRLWDLGLLSESGPIEIVLGKPESLAGRVVNRKGEPIAGAVVYPLIVGAGDFSPQDMIFIYPGMERFAAKSDTSGRFRLEQIPAGWKADLEVRHPNYANLSTSFWQLNAGEEDVRVEMSEPGRIRGRVTMGASNQPAAGIALQAWAQRVQNEFGLRAVTGADGRYEFRNLPAGDYDIRSAPCMNGAENGILQGIVQPRSNMKLGEGQILDDMDLVMIPGIQVQGRVVDDKTSKGIAYSVVNGSQRRSGKDAFQWSIDVLSDVEGRFRIIAPDGFVQFKAGAADYKPARPSSWNFQHGEAPREVAIPLSSNPPLQLSGVVLDPEGKPVANAIARIEFSYAGRTGVRTDGAGKFHLNISDRSLYSGDDMSLYALQPETDQVLLTPLVLEEKNLDVTTRLKPGGVVIGRVLDEEKKPIPKAKIILTRWNKSAGMARTGHFVGGAVAVDGNGRFRIPRLCDGAEYHLTATASGYADEYAASIKGVAGETKDCGDLILLRVDGYVDVTCVDAFGRPVEGVYVEGSGAKQTANRGQRYTDKDGKIRLGPFVPGKLRISYNNPPGHGFASTNLTLVKGKNERITIEIAEEQSPSTRLMAGAPAPKLEGVDWLAGKGDLAALKGKPVALVFFAPGNRPSMTALNRLQALQKELGEDKLAIVAVCDASATAEELKKLWSDKGFAFDLGRVADGDRQGWTSPAFRAYEVRALPGIILINPEGRIHQRDVSISDLEKAARSLVGAK